MDGWWPVRWSVAVMVVTAAAAVAVTTVVWMAVPTVYVCVGAGG